jgi:ribosomal protein S27E
MIKCPNCEHENVPGTQFCEGCGEELAQDSGAGATSNASPQAMIKCPACDNMNPADNVACEVCGAELSGASGVSSISSTSVPSVDAASISGTTAAMPGDATIPVGDNSGAVPIAPIPADLADPTAGALSANASPSDAPAMPPTPIPDMSLPTAPIPPVPPTPPMAPAAPLPLGDLAPGKVKLVVEQGQTVGAQFVLGDAEMLVGREDTDEAIYPDIDLSDQDAGYVHRKHATLRFDNGNLSVEHLGGSNKTRINNKPIGDNEPQPLKLGDKVSFGKVVMRLLPA